MEKYEYLVLETMINLLTPSNTTSVSIIFQKSMEYGAKDPSLPNFTKLRNS